ncbi:MAG: hypothetical protein IJ950_05205 [Helicobacter sp.]|nr:hypothetical protein [Helicobacter sp.]
MAHTYNTRARAPEVGVLDNKDFLIKPADRFETMVADELEILEKRRGLVVDSLESGR